MGPSGDVELGGVELTGERLTLRRWRDDDADRVHAIMADRSMHEFLALPDPYTPEAAREFVTGPGHEGRDEGRGLGCAVVELDSGRLVGSAALRLGGDTDDAELGYWIAPDARGHGYAAEVGRTLAAFAFELGRPRVRIDCDVANLASARTALAAGFRFEGVSRDGTVVARHLTSSTGRSDLARFARLPGDPGTPVPTAFPALPAGGLTDGVVTMRPLAPDDADEFAECEDDVAVALGFGRPPQVRRDFERHAARAGLDWLVGTQAISAIVDDATGALAGSLTLRLSGPPDIGGIGYIVHPLFRGRGYAARALRLIGPWALDAGFARLELGAKEANVASQRAALAAGFEPDGVRRWRLRNVDGTFSDEIRFQLLAPPD